MEMMSSAVKHLGANGGLQQKRNSFMYKDVDSSSSSSDEDVGDPLDADVLDKDDIEARKVCCGETVLNCHRFGHEMRKQWAEMKDEAKKVDAKKHCREIFSMKTLKRILPIINWAPKYRLAELQGDLIAGTTIGLTVLPQSIAYASIAGVAPQYGLYSAFIGSFVYVLFGTSKDITLGPSAVCSLLTAQYATSPIANDPSYAIMLAFLTGIVQIAMFLFGFGFLMNFVSFPVIKAFTTASAITIAASQFKNWFGLSNIPKDFLGQLYWTLKKLPETRLWDFVLGCACITIIITLRKLKEMKWKKRFRDLPLPLKIWKKVLWVLGTARNVIVIVLATITAYILHEKHLTPFKLTGEIPPGIPPFQLPAFSVEDSANNVTYRLSDMTSSIGFGTVILPLIGLLEAMAIGNVFARKFNYRIDPNQELLAYGVGNVLTAFFSGFPVTGTFSRTALNAQSGVKTPAGGIVTGVIVLLSIQFLTPLFKYIPQASLAVVIIIAVVDMITFHKVWIFWKTRKIELLPWLATFVVSLTTNLAYGVFLGVALSLLILLYPTSRPRIKVLKDETATFNEYALLTDDNIHSKIVLVEFDSGLMYPAVDHLKDKIIPLYSSADLPKGIILDFQHVAVIDTTTVQTVRVLLENCYWKGIVLVICNLQKQVDTLFTKSNPKFFVKASSVQAAIHLIVQESGKVAKNAFKIDIGVANQSFDEGFDEKCPADSLPKTQELLTLDCRHLYDDVKYEANGERLNFEDSHDEREVIDEDSESWIHAPASDARSSRKGSRLSVDGLRMGSDMSGGGSRKGSGISCEISRNGFGISGSGSRRESGISEEVIGQEFGTIGLSPHEATVEEEIDNQSIVSIRRRSSFGITKF